MVALGTTCACGRAADHELADQRITALLSGQADALPLTAIFPGSQVNFVCVVDEYVSGSNVVANLRQTGRVGHLQYIAPKDKVPEDMFGLLLIEDRRAVLHLVDRWDVRLGVVETQCFTGDAVFQRDANGFWETEAQSFQTHLPTQSR